MPEGERLDPPGGRAALRERLRRGLSSLGPVLRLVAEDLCGEEDEPIDWLAVEPDGRVVVGLLAPGPAQADLLADGLAQRAWVAARLGDWLKLAPGLELAPALRPRLLLVASRFPRRLRVAAREADASGIWLARYQDSGGGVASLERLDAPERAGAAPLAAPAATAPARGFRSGLTNSDLGPAGARSPRLA